MRRTKLIWFAMGAFTCALVTSVATLAIPVKDDAGLVLRIEEPQDISDNAWEAMQSEQIVANHYRAAELVRGCGVERFKNTARFDATPITDLLVSETSAEALSCILERGPNSGMKITFHRTPVV